MIIGCDSFTNWEAITDFGRNILQVCDKKGFEIVTSVNEEENIRTNDVTTLENMLEETFLVESIRIRRMQIVKIRPNVDSELETTSRIMKQGCEDCLEYASTNNVRWVDPEQKKYTKECIRLCNINISRERSYEEIMKRKIGEN